MKVEIDAEEIIRTEMATKIINAMTEEEKKAIMVASLEKTLKDAVRPWAIEQAIKADVDKYMVEYLKEPDVQEQIKAATRKAVDTLMAGVVAVIIEKSQSGIKSEYEKFIKLPVKV